MDYNKTKIRESSKARSVFFNSTGMALRGVGHTTKQNLKFLKYLVFFANNSFLHKGVKVVILCCCQRQSNNYTWVDRIPKHQWKCYIFVDGLHKTLEWTSSLEICLLLIFNLSFFCRYGTVFTVDSFP